MLLSYKWDRDRVWKSLCVATIRASRASLRDAKNKVALKYLVPTSLVSAISANGNAANGISDVIGRGKTDVIQ